MTKLIVLCFSLIKTIDLEASMTLALIDYIFFVGCFIALAVFLSYLYEVKRMEMTEMNKRYYERIRDFVEREDDLYLKFTQELKNIKSEIEKLRLNKFYKPKD